MHDAIMVRNDKKIKVNLYSVYEGICMDMHSYGTGVGGRNSTDTRFMPIGLTISKHFFYPNAISHHS